MSYYRLYILSRRTSGILRFEEIEAADDAAAMEQAHAFQGLNPMELWCNARKVGRIDSIEVAAKLVARRREARQAADAADRPFEGAE